SRQVQPCQFLAGRYLLSTVIRSGYQTNSCNCSAVSTRMSFAVDVFRRGYVTCFARSQEKLNSKTKFRYHIQQTERCRTVLRLNQPELISMSWYAYCITEQRVFQGSNRARRPFPIENLHG